MVYRRPSESSAVYGTNVPRGPAGVGNFSFVLPGTLVPVTPFTDWVE